MLCYIIVEIGRTESDAPDEVTRSVIWTSYFQNLLYNEHLFVWRKSMVCWLAGVLTIRCSNHRPRYFVGPQPPSNNNNNNSSTSNNDSNNNSNNLIIMIIVIVISILYEHASCLSEWVRERWEKSIIIEGEYDEHNHVSWVIASTTLVIVIQYPAWSRVSKFSFAAIWTATW